MNTTKNSTGGFRLPILQGVLPDFTLEQDEGDDVVYEPGKPLPRWGHKSR